MTNPYSFMHELGIGAETILINQDAGSISMSFTDTKRTALGLPVYVTGDNTIGQVTAATQHPIGFVLNSEEKADRFRTVVQTQFTAIVKAEAVGTITAGDMLNAVAVNSTGELMTYNNTGTIISAIALTGGATTTEITVGILRTTYVDTDTVYVP